MTISSTEQAAAQSLIEAMAFGNTEAVRSLYAGPADISDPFAGRQVDGGFESLIKNWRPVSAATVTSIETTHTTTAKSCSASEITVHLDRDGQTLNLPVVVVSDMDGDGRMLRTRLYYRRAHIDGQQHYRDRMLDHEIEFDFHPTIAKYQKALLERETEEFISTFEEDGYFDGHGQAQDLYERQGMGLYQGKEQLRQGIGQMMTIGKAEAPKGRLEHVNAFSDGTTTVLEFNILRPEENHVHAGVACYELGESGLLKSARVYDEAW